MIQRSLFTILLLATLSYCILPPPVYRPSSGRSADEVAVRAGSRVALFTLLVRRVNVSRSNGLAWVTYRRNGDYQAYRQRLNELLERDLEFELVEQKAVLDSEAYLAGRFPVREKFFLNPELLPIVRGEEDQNLMLRLGRALNADYFVTVLVDHEISKVLFFAPRVEAEVTFNLYGYYGGHITTLRESASEKVHCPAEYEGPANQACGLQINTALDQAVVRAFDRLEKELKTIDVREKGEARRPAADKKPKAAEEDLGKFPQPVDDPRRPRYRRR